jgi:IclR family transcriptional regulator, acetate operon repressor
MAAGRGRQDGQNVRDRDNGRSGVQSIDRVAAILRSFGRHRAELTLSEIARATGLTTSTVHRLLAAMQHNELVRQTRERRYAPGPLLVQLVRGGAVATTLREAAMPTMAALRDEVEETVGLHSLLHTGERVVVDQAESHHPLRRTYTELGTPIPLPYGAPGKVICAWLPTARCTAILDREIPALTPTTVTDPGALRAQLEEIRACGYALSLAERTPGIRSVAAALFDHDGGVTGCLSVSGPEMRMPTERMRAIGARVHRAAWTVSEALGATADVVRSRNNALAEVPIP